MRVALYSREVSDDKLPRIKEIYSLLSKYNIDSCLHRDLAEALKIHDSTFDDHESFLDGEPDFMISLGGDGTFLDTLLYVKDSEIPVMGINMGRLGFLSNIQSEKAELAIKDLINGHFSIQNRGLIELDSNKDCFPEGNIALNDFTIHKRDNTSMITIKTFLNGELFNTYWADGVIVATPTGSTGYSLSCGGPIIFPDSKTFVVSPVAPHNLNIRPIVVSDETLISFEVSGRGSNFLGSLDSRSNIFDYSYQLAINKAKYSLKMVKLNRQNFINTLREKLMWGADSRNT